MVANERQLKLLLHYMIDIIYKTVKPSHSEKLQIIENKNNLMFQFIFTFFDKTNHSFLHPFMLVGLTDFQKTLPGDLSGKKGHE